MLSTKQQIQTILRSIKKGKSNLQVKTSVYLKKIEELLFPQTSSPPILDKDQINLLFKGIEQQKIQGLISLCGNQGKFGGLKKSSYYAIEIVYRCLKEPKNKQEYIKTFYELDNDQFKSMRLATHISDKKGQYALKLCGIIKQKRYHLNMGMYIYSEESQKVFAAWFKQNESKKKHQQQPPQWVETPTTIINPSSLVVANNIKAASKPQKSKHAISALNTQKGKRQPQPIDFYVEYLGDDQEYYIDTYVDPLDLIIAARGEDKQQIKRVKIQNQKLVSYLIMVPSRSIQASEIKDIAKRIHIQSPNFDPKVLLKTFYSQISRQEASQFSKMLSNNILQSRYSRQTFLSFHFGKICEMQILFKNMNAFFGKAESITGQASVGFQLRTKLKTSINKLVQSTNPLLKLFSQSQKTRKIILFLENNKQFTKLPQKLKQLQDEHNYSQICHLFKKYIKLMRNYSTHPILKKLIESINHQLSLLRRQKLLDVYQSMNSGNHDEFMKEVIIIAELFQENVIEEYLIDRFLNEFIKDIQSQSSRFRPENINVMGNLMTKKDLTYFGTVVALDSYQTVNDGDLIAEYFREKITTKQKISGKIDLNQQLHKLQELQVKFKQFIYLSDKIQNGELNTYIIKPHPQANRKKTSKNNRNFLASTLFQWYKLMFDYLKNSTNPDITHIIKLGNMVKIINSFGIKDYTNLQKQNIQYYINHLTNQIKPKLKFQAELLKQDFMKNPYNSNLIDNLHVILLKVQEISKYPLFSEKYVQSLIFPFIISNLLAKPSTKNKRQLLTFSSLCKSINVGRILIPYLFKLKSILKYDDRIEDIFQNTITKQSDRAMKQTGLAYVTIISKQYRETLSQYKSSQFAVEVLDLVVQNIFDIVEYSNNLYNEFKSLVIQTLINDISYIKNNSPPKQLKKFYNEIELVDMMTNRIITKKGKTKINEIIATSPAYTEEEKKAKNNYLLTIRHRYQFRYQSILNY